MASSLISSRKTTLITVLSVVAIIAGLVMIILQSSNINYLKAEIENEKTALNISEMLLIRRMEHQNNASNYQERQERILLMIPENPEEEEILRYFAYLAEEYGFIVSEIRFGVRIPHQDKGYVEMPLTVSMEGRYRELPGLMEHFHRGQRAIRVLDISIGQFNRETAQIRVNLAASAFYIMGN